MLFSAGLLVAGLAPFMWVLVAGRCLQGLGAGAVPAVAYVAIGRSLREVQRARMMAVLSTAWVVPGVLGPGVAAAVAHLFGWRWVFLGLMPLVAVAGPIAVPALVRLGRPGAPPADEHRVGDAVRTAVGAALFLGALGARNVLVGVGLAAVGALVGWASLRRLLPPGTLRAAPGLPATILSRGLLTFAFFGADAYVTLTITTVRHHGIGMAGAVVTASTLAWTAGSWVQARLNEKWEGARLVRTGLVLILVGTAGMAWQLQPGVPVWEAFVAWTGRRSRDGPQLRAHVADDAPSRSDRTRGLGLGLPEPGRRPRHRPRGRRRRCCRGGGLAGDAAGCRRRPHRFRGGCAWRQSWRW